MHSENGGLPVSSIVGATTVGIDAMRASLTADDAVAKVARLVEEPDSRIEQQLFYPYFHFAVTGRLRWLFGERHMHIDCLVDARTGRAASADALTLDRLQVRSGDCVDASQDRHGAETNARRYACHALGKSLRVLGNFNLALSAASLVHRSFWVVRAGELSVLVDAVTGDLHPLTPDRQRVA